MKYSSYAPPLSQEITLQLISVSSTVTSVSSAPFCCYTSTVNLILAGWGSYRCCRLCCCCCCCYIGQGPAFLIHYATLLHDAASENNNIWKYVLGGHPNIHSCIHFQEFSQVLTFFSLITGRGPDKISCDFIGLQWHKPPSKKNSI